MGTGGTNPTATLFGNYKCPYTREFVRGNLYDVIKEFVEPGDLDLRFFNLAYEPDHYFGRDEPSHGSSTYFISSSDPRIARTSLGVWDVDPAEYWKFFRRTFENPPEGWVTYDDLRERMASAGIENRDEIIERAKTDRYEDELRHVEDAAAKYEIPFTPTLELAGDTTAPHHDTQEVLDWIRSRIPDGSDGGSSTSSGGAAGEVATVRTGQDGASDWYGVSFDGSRNSPVVVMNPVSYAGSQPAHVRLRGVGDAGFEFKIEEWSYLDDYHRTETISYLALDAGTATLADGTPVEAGRAYVNETFTDVSFSGNFSSRPVVLTQSQTVRGSDPIVTRQEVSSDGTRVRVQESEANGPHTVEVVGYAALGRGRTSLGGAAAEVGRTDYAVTDDWYRIDFDRSYSSPAFVADLQTWHGTDPAGLRYRNLDGSGVEVRVEEERSANDETAHTNEAVGYVVAERDG